MYEIKNKSVTRGGKRSGAGRKSLYGTPTKAIRVPEHMVAEVRDFVESQNLAEYLLSSDQIEMIIKEKNNFLKKINY